MSIVRGEQAANSIRIRKRLSRPNQYGESVFGYSRYGHYNKYAGVYQQRNGVSGKINVKEKYYWPANPQTAPQQTNRAKMTAGVLAWQALTDNQKDVYRERAKPMPFFGYHLFLKEYLNTH